jgi:hypothetical protein
LIEWIPYNEFQYIKEIAIKEGSSKYYTAKLYDNRNWNVNKRMNNINLEVILMMFENLDDLLNYEYKVSFLNLQVP